MSKPLSEDSIHFLVIGYNQDDIHLYHLRMNGGSKERARIKFDLLAEHNGWSPFQKVEVIRLSTDEELESVVTFGPESFDEERMKQWN